MEKGDVTIQGIALIEDDEIGRRKMFLHLRSPIS